jgi:hypothetical protein
MKYMIKEHKIYGWMWIEKDHRGRLFDINGQHEYPHVKLRKLDFTKRRWSFRVDGDDPSTGKWSDRLRQQSYDCFAH